MNKLEGIISEVRTEAGISLVQVQAAEGVLFTSVVIDTPQTAPYLHTGQKVHALFKETEVIIAKAGLLAISLQNRIPCTIRSIRWGVLLCELQLAHGAVVLGSIITNNACQQLGLEVGQPVIALVKTNEISLSPHA